MGAPETLAELVRTLESKGLHEGLRLLNNRTPHRFTGIYRYDGDMLRNLHLVDALTPELRTGADVPMGDAYCAIVGDTREPLVFEDARRDVRFTHKERSPVVCYCGVLLRDERGEPFGTLCHYDVMPCEAPTHDIPLLEAAAPIVFQLLRTAR
jgi:hypothetical protein